MEDMIDGYDNSKLPLDAVWLDIPFMDNYQNFIVNETAFPSIPAFADKLHDNYRRLIPIIDGGLSADNKQNKYYVMATDKKALI
jgi:alpha-glucosidase